MKLAAAASEHGLPGLGDGPLLVEAGHLLVRERVRECVMNLSRAERHGAVPASLQPSSRWAISPPKECPTRIVCLRLGMSDNSGDDFVDALTGHALGVLPSTVCRVPVQPGATGAYPFSRKRSSHGVHDVARSQRPCMKTTGPPSAATATSRRGRVGGVRGDRNPRFGCGVPTRTLTTVSRTASSIASSPPGGAPPRAHATSDREPRIEAEADG